MIELEKHPKGDEGYKEGDAVTPKAINDTIYTAIQANSKAKAVYANMESAKTEAALALSKAVNIESMANSGAFNTFTTPISGLFGFSVVDGILKLHYADGDYNADYASEEDIYNESKSGFRVRKATGELIFNFE